MIQAIAKRLEALANEGAEVEGQYAFELWSARTIAFLKTAMDPTAAEDFANTFGREWGETLALRRGHLEGLVAISEALTQDEQGESSTRLPTRTEAGGNLRKVFVVHGHDDAAKTAVARFLEKIKLQSIILHEQPNAGRTIIEKFETYSGDVAFAIVLLTPDDAGAEAGVKDNLKPRARQNVIMELGYFIGKLGRTRVCALHKGGVELPSDYQGVLYIEMDNAGAWKTRVAQELVQAKVPIDLNGLLGA